MNQTN